MHVIGLTALSSSIRWGRNYFSGAETELGCRKREFWSQVATRICTRLPSPLRRISFEGIVTNNLVQSPLKSMATP